MIQTKQEKIIIAPQSDFQEKYLSSDATILVAGGEHCASIKSI